MPYEPEAGISGFGAFRLSTTAPGRSRASRKPRRWQNRSASTLSLVVTTERRVQPARRAMPCTADSKADPVPLNCLLTCRGQQFAVGAADHVGRRAHQLVARPRQEVGMVRGVEELTPSGNAQSVVIAEKRLQRRMILDPAGDQLHGINSGTERPDCTARRSRRPWRACPCRTEYRRASSATS